MKKFRIFLQIIIGISIIAFILNKLDLKEVIAVLGKIDFTYFILACISYLLLNLVLAFRLSYLLKKIGHNIKYINVFLSHMGGMIVGDITPGRSGYFLTPPIMKKTSDIPITDGMACIFAPQGIEFILKVGGAAAALIYISSFSNVSRNFIISAMIGAILLLVVGIFMLLLSWHEEKVSSRLLSKIPFFNNFAVNLSFFKDRSILIKNSLDKILILSIIGWFFAAFQWYFLAKAIGIDIPFFAIFLLHPLITILMFVPISPAGLGLMEGGVILVFSYFGISSAAAMAFSVLVRINILFVDLIGLKTVMKASK
ncbi:MAG: lysylphosphatidylglycerol synthase transmembrane domain-containing protein [Candidatus Methanoperedens sp.]|nr:lysylphosphatidylglycerol synthase transmembrane domain-containing protein [Candidatus Methanoperedens sp.]